MNTLKIQTELLKAWADEATRPKCKCAPEPGYGEQSPRVAVTFDGITAHILQRDDCIIDLGKLGAPMPLLWKLMENLDGYALLEPTGVEVVRDKNGRAVEYNGACGKVYLAAKYLARFDKGAQFYARSATNAVIATEEGEVVGLIMPTRPDVK